MTRKDFDEKAIFLLIGPSVPQKLAGFSFGRGYGMLTTIQIPCYEKTLAISVVRVLTHFFNN